eukprot:403375480
MESSSTQEKSVWDIPVTDIKGKHYEKFGDMFGNEKPKATLIANVASNCGFTNNHYTQMEEIYKKYKQHGLEIVGFPCNQFFSQEKGTNDEIFQFVCEKYDATFPLMDKVNVNGNDAHEVFKFLKKEANFNKIGWNFGKFLVNQEGHVIEYDGPMTKPNSMIPVIEKTLGLKQ